MLEFFNSVNVPKLQTPEWNLQSFVALLSSKYEKIVSSVNHEFGPNGMYILLLFALFITLIIIIYVKVVLDTFRSSPRDNVSQQEKTPAEMFYVRDRVPVETELPPIDERIGDVNENEKPRLTRKMPKQANNKKESLKEKDKELSESLLKKTANETNDLLKDKLKQQSKPKNSKNKKQQDNSFDWQKNNEQKTDNIRDNLSYKQPAESIDELICLIINMLGRDITEEKIAQIIYCRNQGQRSEEDILQIIKSVKDFIGLCNSGKFDLLENRDDLPRNNEALYAWAKGDNAPCLILMEALLNKQVAQADRQTGSLKELAYSQAANYACLLGNIASTDDVELAQNSFELAIELSPKSVNAWSRLGDLYMYTDNREQAIDAYQTVLNIADDNLYAEQIANASRHLAEQYKRQGILNKAEELHIASQKFYQEYGIRNALTNQENIAFEIIADKQFDNLQSSIIKLLNNSRVQTV